MEDIAVLDVDGDAEDGADVLEGEETAEGRGGGRGGETAEPGAGEGCVDGVLHGAGPFEVVPGLLLGLGSLLGVEEERYL